MKVSISILSMVLAVAASALASPIQLQGGLSAFQDEYPPATAAEYLSRYLEDRRYQSSLRRNLDQIGGGNLVKRVEHSQEDDPDFNLHHTREGGRFLFSRNLDQIGGGNLVRNSEFVRENGKDRRHRRQLDTIGGGHLLKEARPKSQNNEGSGGLDTIGGGHLVSNARPKSQNNGGSGGLDTIGGGHLINLPFATDDESNSEENRTDRNLDQIGGGHLLRDFLTSDDFDSDEYRSHRNLDQIGGGNLLRSSDNKMPVDYVAPVGHFYQN